MSLENPIVPESEQLPPPPAEIFVEEPALHKNSEGKSYEYEVDGVFYGGDYLPKPPEEISIDDIPPAPENPLEPIV